MDGKHYELRLLPIFEEDLNEIVDYICRELCNPIAAENLVDEVEKALYERLRCPEAFEPYHSAKMRRYPYYRLPVKNYSVFYVVIDHVMEVRRIIYSRRDLAKELGEL